MNRVYQGLPGSFAENVLWVSRQYRTHPWSHVPGGCDVVVEYHNEDIFGYDWIKKPSRYVSAIWNKRMSEIYEDYEEWREEDQLVEIKKKIKKIYARKYTNETYHVVAFKEVWDSKNSNELPWNMLELYDHHRDENQDSNGNEDYEHYLTYSQAKKVIEHIGQLEVRWIKLSRNNEENSICVHWIFADKSYIITPCGPLVEIGMSPKSLKYGYNDDMDIFVGVNTSHLGFEEA